MSIFAVSFSGERTPFFPSFRRIPTVDIPLAKSFPLIVREALGLVEVGSRKAVLPAGLSLDEVHLLWSYINCTPGLQHFLKEGRQWVTGKVLGGDTECLPFIP